MIEILSNGAPNVVQDLGRYGCMSFGVSRSGAMDPFALSIGNALVGNDRGEAGIEINLFPFRVRFHKDTRFAVTGADAKASLDEQRLAPWWGRTASAGQTLVIERPRRGARAYLTIGGGINVKPIMGSKSTDLKGAFGGAAGRGLMRGDRLEVGNEQSRSDRPWKVGLGVVPKGLREYWDELSTNCITVRVLPAAEFERFSPESQTAFLQEEFKVTPDANRVGYRLSGPVLTQSQHVELLSHGIVAGTIQVPPSGQAIVQLAEANTCGGYPKIATVIEADLWKLSQAPIGCGIRFTFTDIDTAVAALQTRSDEELRIRDTLAMMAGRA
ncbi:putative hydrolase subunit [Cupriavidus taiwanensis]|uniref:5-oxoprolinase subunit C family protein n=1 Tax=Cupriavidus taiwanensis TaxID=164546 RepID=UPI000E134C4C|nr:biotin-dependent carboxyltransferase family protein [Cupriavidus taiwanensis]SOY93372.1 putative hydrolase subunit [Cupriavidus taiwanensis]SOY96385.1 putative hydrolase subunit [Cupriavidus taiwanensis]